MSAPFDSVRSMADAAALAERAFALATEIYPIARSITGDGVRETLRRIGGRVPLEVFEVPSGTPAFDWEVPPEWNVREAYIADSSGRRLVDFRHHALHLVGYSMPVRARMTLEELRPHLHTLPEQPDWIPYRTSYYRDAWGFCLSERELRTWPEGDYEVVIDAELKPGHLTYAECLVPGATDQEVLIYTHTCHPALANDNASGMAVAAVLAEEALKRRPNLTYRFVFGPGTIGSIVWLAHNESRLPCVRGGLTIGLLGDGGPLTYKRSRRGATEDRPDRGAGGASSWTRTRSCSISRPMATTNASFAPRASTCRWDASRGRPMTRIPNTTARPTTCRCCAPSLWRSRSWRSRRCSTAWMATGASATSARRASHASASEGCSVRPEAPTPASSSTRCYGY